MSTAMYRPWVCRAKLRGQRSVNHSERSRRPPLLDQQALRSSASGQLRDQLHVIALAPDGMRRRASCFRRETSLNPNPKPAVSQREPSESPLRPFARASGPFTTNAESQVSGAA